jgi:hypothetical protein
MLQCTQNGVLVMPVTYAIDADKKTVRTRCAGQVTLEQVIEHLRALEQDPECPRHLNVFLDLSELDVNSIPKTPQVSRAVLEVQRVEGRISFGACAILAPHDALFGMMRMFEAMTERQFRVTRTFRERMEAEAWLAAHLSPDGSGGANLQPSDR